MFCNLFRRFAANEWRQLRNSRSRDSLNRAKVTEQPSFPFITHTRNCRQFGSEIAELAAFPVPALRVRKYWPPVGRIDSVYGDRNVMCTCPPIEAYED